MYRLESHGRWYFDTDTKPDKVLEQSPNTDALCPNHIHHWLSYCSSYRSTKSSCGPVKWIPTTQPRCKPGSEPGKCCEHVEVTADENAIQNSNLSGQFLFTFNFIKFRHIFHLKRRNTDTPFSNPCLKPLSALFMIKFGFSWIAKIYSWCRGNLFQHHQSNWRTI